MSSDEIKKQGVVSGSNESISVIGGGLNKKNPSINNNGDEAKKKLALGQQRTGREKKRNMITAMACLGVVFVGVAIFGDASTQWKYMRFQKRVLGANFTKLNVSAVKNPCLDSGGNATNPFADQLNEAQSQSAKFGTWSTLVSQVPGILVLTLFGASVDRLGRKVFILIPVSGILIDCLVTLIVCFWELEIEWILIGSFSHGVSGGFLAMLMGMYAYTADNTDPDSGRSLGMVVINSVNGFFFSISHVAIGFVIAEYGFLLPIAGGCILILIGLLGIAFLLKETLVVPKDAPAYSIVEGVKSLFSFYVKKNPDSQHKRVDFILIIIIFVIYAMGFSEGIRTLFLLNEPFCWNSKIIGYMETTVGLTTSVVTIVVQKVLQRFLSDESIVVISMVSAIASRVIFSFANYDWMIYLALAVGLVQDNGFALLRAIASKKVPHNQQGSLLTSLAVIESIFMAATGIATSQLYAHTLSLWKGLTYMFLAVVIGVCLVLLLVYIGIKKRREARVGKEEPKDDITICVNAPDTEKSVQAEGTKGLIVERL